MGIAYFDAADVGGARLRNSLDILVPTDTANLFATYRVGQGRDRTTFVRAPLVSILPPALPHSLADRQGSNTLILSIAAPFFNEVAHGLVGEDAALVEPHATADPLIREVGNAVERDVRVRRPPDARACASAVSSKRRPSPRPRCSGRRYMRFSTNVPPLSERSATEPTTAPSITAIQSDS